MKIQQDIAPLTAMTVAELARVIEIELRRQQAEIYALYQFLQPAMINNANTPNQIFDAD